jgi:hypothetical protein
MPAARRREEWIPDRRTWSEHNSTPALGLRWQHSGQRRLNSYLKEKNHEHPDGKVRKPTRKIGVRATRHAAPHRNTSPTGSTEVAAWHRILRPDETNKTRGWATLTQYPSLRQLNSVLLSVDVMYRRLYSLGGNAL